jgi:hypothetical protein
MKFNPEFKEEKGRGQLEKTKFNENLRDKVKIQSESKKFFEP